jgi:AcrR family transcriptional regulator
MKTVKQIADELGISKQRVYRYIKKNRISEAHQDAGVMYYDEQAETEIIKHFSEIEPHYEAHRDAHQSASHDAVISMLQRELEIKNQQIDRLTTALENTTASLHAAQALHAGTLQGTRALAGGVSDPKPGLKDRWRSFWKKNDGAD